MDEDSRTIWCGNLSEKVTEEILYELFIQGGPVQKVSIPKDRDGKQKNFGFVTYKHECSVPYALDLYEGTTLFSRTLNMKSRNNTVENLQAQQMQQQQHQHLLQSMNMNMNPLPDRNPSGYDSNGYNSQNPMSLDQRVITGLMLPTLMNPHALFMNPGGMMYPSQNSGYGGQGSHNRYPSRNNNRHQARSHPYPRDRDSYDKYNHGDKHSREHKNSKHSSSSHRSSSSRNDRRRHRQ